MALSHASPVDSGGGRVSQARPYALTPFSHSDLGYGPFAYMYELCAGDSPRPCLISGNLSLVLSHQSFVYQLYKTNGIDEPIKLN
jgi:hypothetical protein